MEAIRAVARRREVSLWQAAKEGIASGEFTNRIAKAVSVFLRLVDELAAAAENLPLHELAQHCIEVSGLMAFHAAERGERGLARKENLEELVRACRQFSGDMVFPFDDAAEDDVDEPGQGELAEFLDQVSLDSGETQADSGPAVQMMTLHSAKGLEFPLVFMAGVEEGLFPHRMSAEEPGRLEEERRLAYVGVTRAMRQLYVTYAETRRLHGTDTYNRPSRFLLEIPSEVLEEVRVGGVAQPAFGRSGLSESSLLEEDGAALRMGQRVMHGKFGEGVVLQCEGNGDRARVQVNFSEAGAKWLMLGYANLQALD